MFGLQYHWYRITPLHLILLPLSWLFRALVAVRRVLYRNRILSSQRLNVPVIVIGNISIGGTGKTPLTLAVAQQLIRRGRRPLIVSRGYGGSAQQSQQVSPDNIAQQVGDEPLLMARRNLCPVWIGKDRAAAAQAALLANPQCDVVLCDDGLQHYRLRRDMEIAVIDGGRGFGNGFMLPAGPLREPAARLQTVDAVVVNGGEPTADQYAMHLSGEIFHNLLDPDKAVNADELRKLRCHAVAGIGHPQRYFRHLASLGLNAVEHAFPDHHFYCPADLSFMDCDALLLTEKDAVKCGAFADERYWVLRVEARIDPALTDHILRKIAHHGSETA
ncbi:MAG TPA: tetraacyldisaccharide 4'-kinase [Gallionella sp.]|nr:tetraacyldisaccharide 4'-kinase [Gallionella sp.]